MGLIARNLCPASSPNGPIPNGRIAVAIGLVIVAAIAYLNLQKEAKR